MKGGVDCINKYQQNIKLCRKSFPKSNYFWLNQTKVDELAEVVL